MKYKKLIHPELRLIAIKIPYNKAMIQWANVFQAVSFHFTKTPKGVTNRSILIKGYQGLPFKTEIFEPSNVTERLPCLIDVHGGAFSYKASAHHKKLACIYAMKAGCRVYFPNYHLTPEYPYPAAYKDVLALYRYIVEHSEELRIDHTRIGIAGDSAGAALAALICNRYKLEGLNRPCVQMLVYPVTDAAMQTDSMKRFLDTPLWNAENNRLMWSYYCKNTEDIHSASPMDSVLPKIIPDTYIETAEFDCLHDEGILYGKKLRRAGANVEINETKGTIHGYDVALNTQTVIKNIEKRILFLRKGFIRIPDKS